MERAPEVPTGKLDYSIHTRPGTGDDLLLQKGDGTFDLVVWDERFTGGWDKITVRLGRAVPRRFFRGKRLRTGAVQEPRPR